MKRPVLAPRREKALSGFAGSRRFRQPPLQFKVKISQGCPGIDTVRLTKTGKGKGGVLSHALDFNETQ